MADKRPLILASGGSVQELGADDLLVAHAGPTTIRVDSSNDNASLLLDKGASGKVAAITAYKGAVLRWQINLGDTVAESGSNAGSNFSIGRYNDAGTLLGVAFSIERSTGNATFGSSVSVSGGISSGLNISASGSLSGAFVSFNSGHGSSIDHRGYTTGSYSYASGPYWIVDTIVSNPAGAPLLVRGLHQPGIDAAWQMVVNGSASFTFNNSGTGTAILWSSVSDRRLKNDHGVPASVLERMAQVPLRRYSWKAEVGTAMAGPSLPTIRLGMYAQDLREQFPELTLYSGTEEMPDRLTADYGGVGAVAWRGVVELLKRVESLERRVAELEGART